MVRSDGKLSRRGFFRGQFSPNNDEEANWSQINAPLAAHSGDVLWSGWSDEHGVFIAGDNGAVFHFDGSDWEPQDTNSTAPIHAIWGNSRDNLWAVGWMGSIFKFSSGNWQLREGCLVDEDQKYAKDARNTPLFALDGNENEEMWAVGDHGRILYFSEGNWIEESSGTTAHLRFVKTLADGRVLAGGNNGAVLLRTQTGDWQIVDCPIRSGFLAALPLDDGGVLLAGGRYFLDAHGFKGDLVLWDQEGFKPLFEDAPISRIRDLAIYQGGLIAVGDKGKIYTIKDKKLQAIESGTKHDLMGLINLPSDEILAVGDFGTILAGKADSLEQFSPYIAQSETATNWQEQSSGTDRQLWGTWYDEDNDQFYACGEEGTVLVHDRGQWESLPPCGSLGIHALNRAPSGHLLATGQLGEIHEFDGKSWHKQFDLHMDITLLSLYSDGEGFMVAAGDEGLALQWDGHDWSRMVTGTRSALYGLWGYDRDHLLSVGDFGLVLRWNGQSWDEFSAGTEQFFFDVWGRSLEEIYVVGLSGTVAHFDGRTWRVKPTRARKDLLAITGCEQQIIAVGAGGVATVYDGQSWQVENTGVDLGLRDICVNQNGQFLSVGDQGTILFRA